MLLHISIRNYILLKKVDIDFQKGLSVIIGQTGSGKSILFDAIQLTLALKTPKKDLLQVENGEEIILSAEFDIQNNEVVQRALIDNGIDFNETIIIRRILRKSGPGKIFINDQIVSLHFLKEVSGNLLDFNSQGDQYKILNKKSYRDIIDKFSNNKNLLESLAEVYNQLVKAKKQYDDLIRKSEERSKEIDFLKYAVQELEELEYKSGEEEVLSKKRQKLINSEKIITILRNISHEMSGSDQSSSRLMYNVSRELNKNSNILSSISEYDDLAESVEESINHIEKSSELAQSILSNMKYENIDEVQERLFKIRELSRKYKCSPDELTATLEKYSNNLNELEDLDSNMEEIKESLQKLQGKYMEYANLLTKKRAAAAGELSKKVLAELKKLNLPKARFEITVMTDNNKSTIAGNDTVNFVASMNPGLKLSAIEDVASGGELSRFLLALKTSFSEMLPVSTLIFDEIDTGVSGSTASSIADQLKFLSDKNQVIAVTHATQIATKADHHLKVEKVLGNNDKIAATIITFLDDKDKKEEIAKLLSGHQVSESARVLAAELLEK